MSEQYAREVLRRNVAQICQTIGWNGIHSTPLDILVHLLEKYLQTLGTQTNRYAEQFNRTDPNLHDLGLVFRDLNVQIPELAEYTRSVPPLTPPFHVEKFPKPKESKLNFLKPGSHEVVTRPMHVHEHLPPMYPEKERDTPVVAGTVEIRHNCVDNVDISNSACTSPETPVTGTHEKSKDLFKRPTDPISLPNSKRPRFRLEEEERTREISSVMMTMSGFLSPAREGKLPEARPPTIISEKHLDKHKVNSHSHPAKVPITEKSDKKSRKSKLLNGKIMKSKRKEKSHKGESSKVKDSSKSSKFPPGHLPKGKGDTQLPNNLVPPPKEQHAPSKPPVSPPSIPSQSEAVKSVIKQEPGELVTQAPKSLVPGEEAIPVPRKIPISKSPLVSMALPVQKPVGSYMNFDTENKNETIDEAEKLASQPDRSKINIFKRITNKSKEDKSTSEFVPVKPEPEIMISKLQKSVHDNSNEVKTNEIVRIKSVEGVVNNNDTCAVDLSKEFDLRAHEVINVDDDSLDISLVLEVKPVLTETQPTVSVSKTLHPPNPKDVARVSPKVKKEKKHKDKKDKAAKLEAKLLKKQQQALAFEMAQTNKHSMKSGKPPKSSRPKNESKVSQIPAGFPFFPSMPLTGRKYIPGPGLIPPPSIIPGSDFLAGLANNPALRGFQSTNLLTNPFALGSSGPGLISGSSFLPGNPGHGMPNPLMPRSNYPHSSRSPSVKIPPMLRRPSLEVIPVDNDEERSMGDSPDLSCEKGLHEKNKLATIPNILQKHHKKCHKDHKSLFKMPPVQPDITIELNPPKENPKQSRETSSLPLPTRSAPPDPVQELPKPEPPSDPMKPPSNEVAQHKEGEVVEKKKDKSHKKDKKDKDGIKIKKKKDKKNKNKDKSEKKREKEERHELKERIKKGKKEKKQEKSSESLVPKKSNDGLVPKLTLKLGSSNSNSPMPPSSPDVFKLNIKPVVKKEEPESSPLKEEPLCSREHSRSPELAQISALVTRPPKQKHTKHNHAPECEAQSSSPPSESSARKNRPPSSHFKYKRILFKPLSKKGHFEDDMTSTEEPTPSRPPTSTETPTGPLPTPYYLDEHGNKIWVCPACGRPDNGSPMIGCDGCDGWYHWVCVGITEEPGATEDWFCKSCLAKRTAMMLAGVTTGKKRGRKPKGEKIRDCH